MLPIIQQKLNNIYRFNRKYWSSVFAGMILLAGVTSVFHYTDFLHLKIAVNVVNADRLAMFLIIILIVLIFYIKQNYLRPPKLVERARKTQITINHSDIAELLKEFTENALLLGRTLVMQRRYLMLIWSLANMVVIIAFINYILAMQFQTFIIYCVVGFYSLVINYPFYKITERLYYRLEDEIAGKKNGI